MAGNRRGSDGLTDKQRVFRDALASSVGQSEAYRKAFDCSGMSDDTIAKRAYELAKLPKIAASLQGIVEGARAVVERKVGNTLADLVKEADDAIEFARALEQPAALVSAATFKAKLLGHLVERKEVRSGHLEDSDTAELMNLKEELRKAKESEARAKAEAVEAQELVGAIPSPAVIKEIEQQGNRPTSRVLQ